MISWKQFITASQAEQLRVYVASEAQMLLYSGHPLTTATEKLPARRASRVTKA